MLHNNLLMTSAQLYLGTWGVACQTQQEEFGYQREKDEQAQPDLKSVLGEGFK